MQTPSQSEPLTVTNMDTETDKRVRTLTEKGNELYEETRNKHCYKLDKICNSLDIAFASIPARPTDLLGLREIERNLEQNYSKYCTHSAEYLSFLARYANMESFKDADSHKRKENTRKLIVENALKQVKTFIDEVTELESHHSGRSKKSTHSSNSTRSSSASAILTKKRAKAEAARARVEFAIKESEILKQKAHLDAEKAHLDADLQLLAHEKEAAAAEAEMHAYQSESDSNSESFVTRSYMSPSDSIERTKRYVDQQSQMHKNSYLPTESDHNYEGDGMSSNPYHHSTENRIHTGELPTSRDSEYTSQNQTSVNRIHTGELPTSRNAEYPSQNQASVHRIHTGELPALPYVEYTSHNQASVNRIHTGELPSSHNAEYTSHNQTSVNRVHTGELPTSRNAEYTSHNQASVNRIHTGELPSSHNAEYTSQNQAGVNRMHTGELPTSRDTDYTSHNQASVNRMHTGEPPTSRDTVYTSHNQASVNRIHTGELPTSHVQLNAEAPAFVYNTVDANYAKSSHMFPSENMVQSSNVELNRYRLKKDLLLSRLTQFNDKPENYMVWKSSFSSVMSELRASTREELDLLVKWLGNESAKYALSIRASNPNNPERALHRLWERMDDRYGCPEMVEAALKKKLTDFPRLSNKDNIKLYDLSDILSEIESVKEDSKFKAQLSYYDTSSGVKPIVNKLQYQLQEKWTGRATEYKRRHDVTYPPFSEFCEFIREMSKVKNDPSFTYDYPSDISAKRDVPTARDRVRSMVTTQKTEVYHNETPMSGLIDTCPIHKTKHGLIDCRTFRSMTIEDRRNLLRDNKICFRCCNSYTHFKQTCPETIHCEQCDSDRHPTALHVNNYRGHNPVNVEAPQSPPDHGGERKFVPTESVSSKCTQICGSEFCGKSCAKISLVNVYPDGRPEHAIKTYAIIDDQSNRSLARSDFFSQLNVNDGEIEYSLTSCSGSSITCGRVATGCIIETLDGQHKFQLPTILECDQIPNNRHEIPTPEIAANHPHLVDITTEIPPLEPDAEILLLIGRDLIEAHHVLDQRTGPRSAPYAQKLGLGWVIIGETCLGDFHASTTVNVNKTHVLKNGRESLFAPCENGFNVTDNDDNIKQYDAVFEKTENDDKPGMSLEDKEFIEIMDNEMRKNSDGNWEVPLPFRTPRPRLVNNRQQALNRAKSLDYSLKKNPDKKEHMVRFMQGVLDNEHAELAPPLSNDEECWYLPIFGVYHPRKPNQIRAVFDSSAKHEGISLNDVLLTGPDMTNSLLGVLLRFRKESVAVTTDIQQMFHCFYVRENHRNYLRFLWYRDNNPDNELVEYRMCVHVFGNSPSPAIATYGLRKTAENSIDEFGEDIKQFVEQDLYVDDGLTSRPTVPQAIDLIKRTKNALQSEGNLRLHKIASNNDKVIEAFPVSDLAKDLQQFHVNETELPLQRSLGLIWDINSDSFTFQVSEDKKPYTRRGLLSTVNSLFDPLGFVAPVTIEGKLFLRDLMTESKGWDEPLSTHHEQQWVDWRDSLSLLQDIHIPRTYSCSSLSDCVRKEIHIFSDASEQAIAAVAYMKTTHPDGTQQLGFIMGKAKVAPKHGHTIPRLELCAAVLATELCETILDQLGITANLVRFYTDSKVVLGYINNKTRRFYVYVSNRVQRIHKSSKPEQWQYIPTNLNPADCATRPSPAASMDSSPWLLGPTYLLASEDEPSEDAYDLLNPNDDKELRPGVEVLNTQATERNSIGTYRFDRFSVWSNLVETIAVLKHIAGSYHNNEECKGWHLCPNVKTIESYHTAELFIIKAVQREEFNKELACIAAKRHLPSDSTLSSLNPVVDENGILRVGGRLSRSDLPTNQKNPIIIPKHHIATLLVRHYHDEVKHQGRHFTEGAIRSAGFWIIGAKRLISSVIHKCVKCRKLRGKFVQQKMSDLPVDRVSPGPPFSSVGVDTFGPWSVVTRRTRGGQANSKRWAILFTCLATRAVHIEVVEELSSSSFINALRRFTAIRGNVKIFRSDCGTNFVGATKSLNIEAINVEDGPVRDYLYKKGTVWVFNSPHASHMGGVWERMIGVTRRILDSMLTDLTRSGLTNEVLVTLMAEITAIINARPLVPLSSDPEETEILTPSTILTLKYDKLPSLGEFELKDMYRSQWKRVQILADMFWNRWRREYLQILQSRRKWQNESTDIKCGNVVLLMDSDVCRNEWPVGVIINAIPSEDGKVRKAEVRVMRDGKPSIYTRPVTKMVLLVSDSTA